MATRQKIANGYAKNGGYHTPPSTSRYLGTPLARPLQAPECTSLITVVRNFSNTVNIWAEKTPQNHLLYHKIIKDMKPLRLLASIKKMNGLRSQNWVTLSESHSEVNISCEG